ncbi:hypothetical protein ACTFIZ_002716 [Dictyostelium cf. discoideum]
MNIKNFLFLFLFLFIVFNKTYSYDIEKLNYSPQGNIRYGSIGGCSFTFYFKVTDLNFDQNPISGDSISYAHQLYQNLSSKTIIYSLIPRGTGFPFGSNTAKVIDSNLNQTILEFPYTCLEPKTEDLIISLVGKIYPTEFIGNYQALIKVGGLNSTIGKAQYFFYGFTCQTYDCMLVENEEDSKSEYFKVNVTTSVSNVTQPFIISFQIGNSSTFHEIVLSNNLLPQNNDEITDYLLWPNDINNIKISGLNLGTAVTFVSNLLPFQSAYGSIINSVNFGNEKVSYLFPIYGDTSSTKYIYHLPANLYSYQGDSSLKFLSQDGSLLVNQGGIAFDFSYLSEIKLDGINNIDPTDYTSLGSTVFVGYNMSNSNYTFKTMNIVLYSYQVKTKSPFGFKSGQNSNYYYSVEILTPKSSGLDSPFLTIDKANPIEIVSETPINWTDSPIFQLIELEQLEGSLFILRIKFTSKNGFKYVISQDLDLEIDILLGGIECLVFGTIYNGTYEILIDNTFIKLDYLRTVDQTDQYLDFSTPYFYSDILPPFDISSFKPKNKIQHLKNIKFEIEEINVSNVSVANRVYFSFDKDEVPNNYPINFFTQKKSLLQNDIKYFPIVWNPTLNLFQSDFYVDANVYHGNLVYGISFGDYQIDHNSLPTQLNVISKNMDYYGPIFEKISLEFEENSFGWNFIIEDLYNGFEYGLITVRGSIDSSLYEFELRSSNDLILGDKFTGHYSIRINSSNPCKSQSYVITNVFLNDTMGRYSRFSLDEIPDEFDSFNPFINFLDEMSITSIESPECGTPEGGGDTTPPELISFTVSSGIIDVGSLNRTISFNFETRDSVSGIKYDQNPIVYILGADLKLLQCKSKLLHDSKYYCEIELPIAFGYPHGALLSIYGIVNNNGYFSGFSSFDLDSMGFQSSINISTYSIDNPIITSHKDINSNGGNLWIFGKGFNGVNSVTITYYNQNLALRSNYPIISKVYQSAILISNILPTNNSFTIKVSKSSSSILTSNIYTIKPWIALYDPTPPYLSPSSSSSSSTETINLPTNSPQQCKNNCGGSSKGICTPNGCICFTPYIGIDCSSTVIIIPQPKPNTTEPSISIDIPISGNNNNNNNNSSNELITLKSIINLVAIREITFDDSVYKTHRFEKWTLTEINEKTQQYITTIGDDINNQTIVNVTLQWFDKESNISFAQQIIKMNPSSIKYTIELSKYKFNSALNKLQLVMSAQLETNSNDDSICSANEFGDTSTGDDSNYIKIQIDEHSLYGRLLKRGIIDNRIVSISNSILDNEMNAIKTPTKSQSFIGIDIPHYSVSSIIDPDFSVLLDHSKSDGNNNICNSKSDSGLSSAQLAGIIIGSVGFATVIVVSIIYHNFRKKNQKAFMKNVNQKLKTMNEA